MDERLWRSPTCVCVCVVCGIVRNRPAAASRKHLNSQESPLPRSSRVCVGSTLLGSPCVVRLRRLHLARFKVGGRPRHCHLWPRHARVPPEPRRGGRRALQGRGRVGPAAKHQPRPTHSCTQPRRRRAPLSSPRWRRARCARPFGPSGQRLKRAHSARSRTPPPSPTRPCSRQARRTLRAALPLTLLQPQLQPLKPLQPLLPLLPRPPVPRLRPACPHPPRLWCSHRAPPCRRRSPRPRPWCCGCPARLRHPLRRLRRSAPPPRPTPCPAPAPVASAGCARSRLAARGPPPGRRLSRWPLSSRAATQPTAARARPRPRPAAQPGWRGAGAGRRWSRPSAASHPLPRSHRPHRCSRRRSPSWPAASWSTRRPCRHRRRRPRPRRRRRCGTWLSAATRAAQPPSAPRGPGARAGTTRIRSASLRRVQREWWWGERGPTVSPSAD